MARNTFLNKSDLDNAQIYLLPPLLTPRGIVKHNLHFQNESFSRWLGLRLESRFREMPGWFESQPIALGSWARENLCPNSDIDLLFCGPHTVVKNLVDVALSEGLPLRYRVPADQDNWTKGVEIFDVIALLGARPFTPESAQKLIFQQKQILDKKFQFFKDVFKVLKEERSKRSFRYDSITNLLEPNLKYGPGGLRDLNQALFMYKYLKDNINDGEYALSILNYYKDFFLTVRQKIHLLGGGEVFDASLQREIALWLGYVDQFDFMKEIQKGLSRVSFHADWIFENATQWKKKNEKSNIYSVRSCFKEIKNNSDIFVQYQIRKKLPILFKKQTSQLSIARSLTQLFMMKSDAVFIALFRSRLLHWCIPRLMSVEGVVQHDQFHRYTVETHIWKALRELNRIRLNPSHLKSFRFIEKQFTQMDWKVLFWSILYHDLGKSMGGDHSLKGGEIVIKDFKQFGFSHQFTKTVEWLVLHHLSLSNCAFRENPNSPQTWKKLQDQGVVDKKLLYLIVITIVDIRATNPDAWTNWKETLLKQLYESLSRKSTKLYLSFFKRAKENKVKLPGIVEKLDLVVIESVPYLELVKDLKALTRTKKALDILVIQNRQKEIWVRIHSLEDKPGSLVHWVEIFYSLGLNIRQAAIHTFSEYGIYNWFCFKTKRSKKQISKLLSPSFLSSYDDSNHSLKDLTIKYDWIGVVSKSEQETIVSFRGKDQKGFLYQAVKILFDLGASINWARVHTWGNQVDDVFGLTVSDDFCDELISKDR